MKSTLDKWQMSAGSSCWVHGVGVPAPLLLCPPLAVWCTTINPLLAFGISAETSGSRFPVALLSVHIIILHSWEVRNAGLWKRRPSVSRWMGTFRGAALITGTVWEQKSRARGFLATSDAWCEPCNLNLSHSWLRWENAKTAPRRDHACGSVSSVQQLGVEISFLLIILGFRNNSFWFLDHPSDKWGLAVLFARNRIKSSYLGMKRKMLFLWIYRNKISSTGFGPSL